MTNKNTTTYYNVDLTIETDGLTKKELKTQLENKLQKNVPEQKIDLVMTSKIEKVNKE